MSTARSSSAGKLFTEFEVANYCDMVAAREALIPMEQVRRAKVRGVVDTKACHLRLPEAVVKRLGLPRTEKIRIRYRNNRRVIRDVVEAAHLGMAGRDGTFKAIVEPKRKDAVIGFIVLNTLDLLPDWTQHCLVPRDPNFIVVDL